MMGASNGPLTGVRVLDLSRILAGPSCTQLLGDLGATVLKIENPKAGGDDTRSWGPPYVDGANELSAYFLSANRNKHSIAVDIATADGQALVRRLARDAHMMIQNFKPDGLVKYGLDYDSLKAEAPHLVYASISGFGQTGPNRHKPGYDVMAQGWGGIMSLTGDVEGPPAKVGVGIADVMTGMYAAVGMLAALRHAEATGQGQHIDVALVDTQISWLINEGCNYLVSGQEPQRRGNMHPNIVPYGVYPCADGHVIVAVGNDSQFARFCAAFDLDDLATDQDLAQNPGRVAQRGRVDAAVTARLEAVPQEEIISRLDAVGVPVGPVQTLAQVFASSQVAHREMQITLENEGAACPMIANPLKFSKTQVSYRHAPPKLGQHNGLCAASDPWTRAENEDNT